MNTITSYFHDTDKKKYGYHTFKAKYDESFYRKNKLHPDGVGCGSSTSLKNLRYLNWSDKTGFVLSGNYRLLNVCHKRPYTWCNEDGFDHTTFWRRPNERFPLFCLTEPYHLPAKEYYKSFELTRDEYKAKGNNLEFLVLEPSEKSLWVPNSTYMVFWWCPDYFDLKANLHLLLSHEDACVFEKKCEVHINEG